MHAAHEAGVVHRDLKPDNIFIIQVRDGAGSRESVKILDLGVAKVAGSAKLTKTGMVFGTPHYMSPEQASGGAIDARTDIYALGVIMYEMFTGRVPFEADTYMGVLTKHMFEAPIPPSQLEAPIRELGALEDVTLRALAKRPEDRYRSMVDLVSDIDRVVQIGTDGHPFIAHQVAGIMRPDFEAEVQAVRRSFGSSFDNALPDLADQLEPPARAELVASDENRRRKRVRQVGIIVAASIVVIGLAASINAFTSHRDPRRPAPSVEAHPVTLGDSPSADRVHPAAKAAALIERTARDHSASVSERTPFDPPKVAADPSSSAAGAKGAAHPNVRPVATVKRIDRPVAGGSDPEDPWGKK
ncbi:MAG: hypothetical protein NVSMB1_25750 [Polyangiales bacterium]